VAVVSTVVVESVATTVESTLVESAVVASAPVEPFPHAVNPTAAAKIITIAYFFICVVILFVDILYPFWALWF